MPGKRAVLFDLGGTLVEYYRREEFPQVLREALGEVGVRLRARGLQVPPPDRLWRQAEAEDHESSDFRVRPLAHRLRRIYELPEEHGGAELLDEACRGFLAPIFARARLYQDALPVLRELRARGVRTGIVSNTPWGSPAGPWHEEVRRLGLADVTEAVIFCAEVGWRKPARDIFLVALGRLGVEAQHALFVGDDPRWDLAGPRALGMEAILLDRTGAFLELEEARVTGLEGVLRLV
ncbi:MAG: HAD family hydrolase [Anaerolineae bacterium]|nr:HAD family hydrolase [Anaerolineae bacterium]